MKHVPRWTRVASIGGAATAGLTAVWAAARYAPWDAHIVVIAAALSPMAIVPACLATALLAWARRRVATTLAALLAVAILAAQLPLAVAGSPAPGERFVVMTMNMEYGEADAAQVVALALASAADVVALQEVTPDALTRLDAAGMGNAFPSSVRAPATGATGVALFSRRAVTEPVVVAGWPMGAVSARIERGAGIPGLTLFSVHVPAPWPWTDGGWRGQLAAMPNLFSVISGPLVVAGDFNATLDHAPFRSALEGAGLTDAARAAGAGWLPTFPADRPFPPVIAIDHVLVRDASAVLATTTTVTGTDHRALVATLTLPST